MASKITLEIVSILASWNGDKLVIESKGESQGHLMVQAWKQPKIYPLTLWIELVS